MKQFPYQWRALLLMMMGWGFAGLVHNCVAFLFPYFSLDFQLGAAHNGYLAGTLAFFWTLAIFFGGPLAERVGQVKVIASGFTLGAVALALVAMSHSVVFLYVLMALTGLGCGTIVSASFSFLIEQSDPKNRGLFFGAAQSTFTLVGSAIGAVVFTRLGDSAIGWRGSYLLMAALVFGTAATIFLVGRGIPRNPQADEATGGRFRELLAYKNVVLSTVLACLMMMWYLTVAAYTILFLMEDRGMSAVAAGAIFAGFGSGGFIGEFAAPMVSDRLGRKATCLVAVGLGGLCFAAFVFLPLSSPGMTLAIAGAACFMSGGVAILNSVVPSESVPPHLVATATSFTPAAGECMGGVIAPVIAGMMAGTLGTAQVMNLLAALPLLVLIGVCFLKETAPLVLARRS